ncbi:MAG: ABC transporter substrate-binding protein [Spirochaetaceae bacterium]|nr:ABC transporter substrate-binding protein [Spirochaetaceae bacterium]
MTRFKYKATVILVFAVSIFSVSCGGPASSGKGNTPRPDSAGAPAEVPVSTAKYTDDGRRIITIGTWYDRYYVSKHKDINDDPRMTEPVTAQMQLDAVRKIEAKYNVVLNYVNLTFEGVQESINSSAGTGMPDVDIYEADLQFGIPAALNNYAVSLEEMGLRGTDVFGPQTVMKYLALTGQQETFLFTPASNGATNAYVLAFNMDLIDAARLPNPQDLYDRGEWTWEKWREYLRALTRDTDGDGSIDIYGFSGYWTYLLANLLLSNNTGIAPGLTETLSDRKTTAVLEFINTIYNIDKTARPWDRSNWEINNRLYGEGLSGFWIGADWIFNEQGSGDLPFKIGVVPWPRGPAGSFEENRHSQPQGNWYFIPRGVEDPRLVYDVIFDWMNWYNGDLSIGAANVWSRTMYMTERNYQYASMMASKPGFDLWENLGTGFSLLPLLFAEQTPAELVAENRQVFQDALDKYFK